MIIDRWRGEFNVRTNIGGEHRTDIDVVEDSHVYFAAKGEGNGEDFYAEWATLDAVTKVMFINVRNAIAATKTKAIADIKAALSTTPPATSTPQ